MLDSFDLLEWIGEQIKGSIVWHHIMKDLDAPREVPARASMGFGSPREVFARASIGFSRPCKVLVVCLLDLGAACLLPWLWDLYSVISLLRYGRCEINSQLPNMM